MSKIGSVVFVVVAIAAGCGGGSSAQSPSGTAGTCGLTLYTNRYDPRCQQNLDATCCAAEKACGAQQGCAKLTACMNECSTQADKSCADRCGAGMTSADAKAFDDLTRCSQYPDDKLPPAAKCGWPSGGGPPYRVSDLREPSYGISWSPSPGCGEIIAVDSDGTVWRGRSCPPDPKQPLKEVRPMGKGFHQAVAEDFAPLRAAFDRRDPNQQCPGGAQFETSKRGSGGGIGACLDAKDYPTDPVFARAWDRLQSATR